MAVTWSTQQLAEFVAAVSTATSEDAVALVAVERAAEAFDADVAAIVGDGAVIAAVGYPRGAVPVADLETVKPGLEVSSLDVPGVGACAAAAAALEHPKGARLVVARPAADGFTREEWGLLQGMARVASLTMRIQRVLDEERAARVELERLVREQAALRTIATLVAEGASPESVFAAVAEEVARVVPAADVAFVGRYDGGVGLEFVGGWTRDRDSTFVGDRVGLGGRNVSTLVFEDKAPARVDHLADDSAPATAFARQWARSSAGAPINVERRLWGVMAVGSLRPGGLPAGIEHELAAFTELIGTAIANAQAREELQWLVEEQAALRRVATLVALGEPPEAVFTAVAEEVGRLFAADAAGVIRYNPAGDITPVGSWNAGLPLQSGPTPARPLPLGGHNVTTLVHETARPARIDAYPDGDASAITAIAQGAGARSAVGVPIIVGGRLWGSLQVAMAREGLLPSRTEDWVAAFAELAATALANAQAREELRLVADEQAALRRVATLVAEEASPPLVFAAVAEEVGRLLDTDYAYVVRYDAGGGVIVAHWGEPTKVAPLGFRQPLDRRSVSTLVHQTGGSARIDDYSSDADAAALAGGIRSADVRSAAGAPITVGGRLWGLIAVSSASEEPLPPETERRLAHFTELAATAVANAQAQAELTASRARVVAAADETRRRIERDLHDGAQQRLVTLTLQVRAVQAAFPPALEGLVAELDGVAEGLTRALDELREYARGIHPALLSERGLHAALKTLARRCAVPVELEVTTAERLPEPIEVGAYYVVSESLANVAKHAEASAAYVRLATAGNALHISVRDDGVGGASFGHGSGLLGLKDRAEALGGRITLESQHGSGTTVRVVLPLPVWPSASENLP
jgi:signal transduction histidine kinase